MDVGAVLVLSNLPTIGYASKYGGVYSSCLSQAQAVNENLQN